MHIETSIKLKFQDVLIKPKRSTLMSRNNVTLERTFITKHSQQKLEGVPIIASNMDTTGTFEMAVALQKYNLYTILHKFYSIEQWVEFSKTNSLKNCFISSGISDIDLQKMDEIILKTNIQNICLDVANGYTEVFLNTIKKVRAKYPSHVIMAGNVCTPEMTQELIIAGADIVKIGIGCGIACATRNKTGVGYPQLSCVIECSDVAHGLGGLVVSDGGCREPCDISKAFGGGADFVILGGMFSGHDESGGDIVIIDGKKYKEFYGMSSDKAMMKYHNNVPNYRASEGLVIQMSYKGPVSNTLKEILGGLRSTCTYVGATCLQHLSNCTTFIRQIN